MCSDVKGSGSDAVHSELGAIAQPVFQSPGPDHSDIPVS